MDIIISPSSHTPLLALLLDSITCLVSAREITTSPDVQTTDVDGCRLGVVGCCWMFSRPTTASTNLVGGSWGYANGTAEQRLAIAAQHQRYTRGILWFFKSDPSVPAPVRAAMGEWALCADEFADSNNFPPQAQHHVCVMCVHGRGV